MRVILIFIVLLLASCGSDPEPEYASEISFNIKGGFYESMKVMTWEDKSSICSSLAIMMPDYTTKWLPAVRLNFLGEDERYSVSIVLAPHSAGDKELQLIYKLYDNENKSDNVTTVLKDHIKFGKSVAVEIFFSGERGFGVRLDNSGQIFNLPFEPKTFVVIGSSGKSKIKFSIDTCAVTNNESKTASSKSDTTKSK